jgi:uncharacterized membrane protein (UPF0127 family)
MLLNINNKIFKVKTVFTEKDTSKGMMGKKFNTSFNGMLFVMEPGQHCFWMKNCIISLDIIFIENGIIRKIHHNCPPCNDDKCKNYCGTGDLILEVAGETCKKLEIKEGDFVNFG